NRSFQDISRVLGLKFKLRVYERTIKIIGGRNACYIQRFVTPDQHKTSKQRWRDIIGMRGTTSHTLCFHGKREYFVAFQGISHEVIHSYEGSNRACSTGPHTATKREVFIQLDGDPLIVTSRLQILLNSHARGVSVRVS